MVQKQYVPKLNKKGKYFVLPPASSTLKTLIKNSHREPQQIHICTQTKFTDLLISNS